MKSPNTFTNNDKARRRQAGFTYMEIAVVMAIFVVIMGFGLFIGMDVYRGYSFSSETDIAVSVFQRSRSRALNNVHGSPHGVYVASSSYHMFVGDSYATRDTSKDETIPAHPSIALSGLNEVVFSQLSGDASPQGVVVVSDGGRTSSISINHEGTINW